MSPFPYTIVVLAIAATLGLIAGGLAALIRRGRDGGGGTGSGTIVARALSYAGLAVVLGLAASTGVPGIAVLAAVIGAVGLVEWSALADLPDHHRVALQITNLAIVALVATLGADAAVFVVGGATLAGMLWPVIRADPTRAMRDLGFAAIGVILLPGMLAHGIALVVERGELGSATFVALAIAVAAADVCAFLVGRRFGRTPLAPRLSLAKTRAGAVGSLIGAAVGIAVFAPVLVSGFGAAFTIALVPIVAIGAIWGDLFESAAKREAGQKDAGRWLPGFGGILDRVDSLLITLPLAYWALRLVDLAGTTS